MRNALAFLLAAVAVLCCGCTAQTMHEEQVLVFLEEQPECTISDNGQRVSPGSDVTFQLTFDWGVNLASVDYEGASRWETEGGVTTLTLVGVTRPTRVKLTLSRKNGTITYDANGGDPVHGVDTAVTKSYSLSNHLRPNTDTGADLFTREGYTLLCWNTAPDGSGERIGLGSRVGVDGGSVTLYAQWAPWTDSDAFTYEAGDTVTITGCSCSDEMLVIPAELEGRPVTAIASGAVADCPAATIVLPSTMDTVESAAFQACAVETLVLFDTIVSIRDDSFVNCEDLRTLAINALEAPFGYGYRKESCYADKVELLLAAQGQKKLVFYGGCSMWYNLDGSQIRQALGEEYQIINMGLNGTVNSAVQMQILGAFLEEGDLFFHTPELSSRQQMLTESNLRATDKSLWCGLENNYDLFTLVDLRTVGGVFDSLCAYLERKDSRVSYTQYYTDEENRTYMDELGCIPFSRIFPAERLGDRVDLDISRIDSVSMERLEAYYDAYQAKGVTVYLSYACVNLDGVPEEQRGNVEAMDTAFRQAVEAMDGPVLISKLEDYVYHQEDFYDTNYHLLTQPARENTACWLRDLLVQMQQDGLWEGPS